jgi:hypothetical protein
MAKYSRPEKEQERHSPPATTVEGRENQMISLAIDLAEKRMRAGTASAQEVCHFLKAGSINAKIERDILEKQKELITAKTESLRASKRVDELYADAISAMRAYSGNPDRNDDED